MRRIVNIVKFILTISYERHSSTTLRSRGKFCYIHKKGLRMFVVRWHREGRRGKWVSGGRWETVGGRFQKGFGFFFFFFFRCEVGGCVATLSGWWSECRVWRRLLSDLIQRSPSSSLPFFLIPFSFTLSFYFIPFLPYYQ